MTNQREGDFSQDQVEPAQQEQETRIQNPERAAAVAWLMHSDIDHRQKMQRDLDLAIQRGDKAEEAYLRVVVESIDRNLENDVDEIMLALDVREISRDEVQRLDRQQEQELDSIRTQITNIERKLSEPDVQSDEDKQTLRALRGQEKVVSRRKQITQGRLGNIDREHSTVE